MTWSQSQQNGQVVSQDILERVSFVIELVIAYFPHLGCMNTELERCAEQSLGMFKTDSNSIIAALKPARESTCLCQVDGKLSFTDSVLSTVPNRHAVCLSYSICSQLCQAFSNALHVPRAVKRAPSVLHRLQTSPFGGWPTAMGKTEAEDGT